MTFSCRFTWAVRSRAPDVMGRSGGNGRGLAGAGCGAHHVRAVGIGLGPLPGETPVSTARGPAACGGPGPACLCPGHSGPCDQLSGQLLGGQQSGSLRPPPPTWARAPSLGCWAN